MQSREERQLAKADAAAEKARKKSSRAWYQKKRWIAVMVIGAFMVLGSLGDDTSPAEPTSTSVEQNDPEPAPEPEDDGGSAIESALGDTEPDPEPEPDVVADEPAPEPDPEPEPEPPKFREGDYDDLTAREFSKIARDPNAHVGEQVLVFGEVFQFDSRTGTDQFLADVDGDRDTEGEEFGFLSYDHTALLGEGEFKRAKFDDVVEDDHFVAWVTVIGSFDYDTAIGGSNAATALMVDRIKVLPAVD